MKRLTSFTATLGLVVSGVTAAAEPADPRLREVVYDPRAVVTVPVKRGVVTLVVLDTDESITEVAAGLGGDCAKAESAWCVAAQPGGRNFFVKAKSSASAANNLAVVTDRRTHAFSYAQRTCNAQLHFATRNYILRRAAYILRRAAYIL